MKRQLQGIAIVLFSLMFMLAFKNEGITFLLFEANITLPELISLIGGAVGVILTFCTDKD